MTDFFTLLSTASERIFQSSDLKKDRGLLDAARTGLARLRDTDGMGLVMLREAGLQEWARESQRDHLVAETSAEFVRVELLIDRLGDDDRLDPVLLGAWSWLGMFDRDDLQEFVTEMRHALAARDVDTLQDALMGWEETAAALADPERMAAHAEASASSSEDWVELDRPEDGIEDASVPAGGAKAVPA